MKIEITPQIELKIDYYNYTFSANAITQGQSGDKDFYRGSGANQSFVASAFVLVDFVEEASHSVFDTLPGEESPDMEKLLTFAKKIKAAEETFFDVPAPEFDHQDWEVSWQYGIIFPMNHQSYKTKLLKPNGNVTKTWYPSRFGQSLWRIAQWDLMLVGTEPDKKGKEPVTLDKAIEYVERLKAKANELLEDPSALDPHTTVHNT